MQFILRHVRKRKPEDNAKLSVSSAASCPVSCPVILPFPKNRDLLHMLDGLKQRFRELAPKMLGIVLKIPSNISILNDLNITILKILEIVQKLRNSSNSNDNSQDSLECCMF